MSCLLNITFWLKNSSIEMMNSTSLSSFWLACQKFARLLTQIKEIWKICGHTRHIRLILFIIHNSSTFVDLLLRWVFEASRRMQPEEKVNFVLSPLSLLSREYLRWLGRYNRWRGRRAQNRHGWWAMLALSSNLQSHLSVVLGFYR